MRFIKVKSGLFIFLVTFSSFFMITFLSFNSIRDREENLPFDLPEDLRTSAEWTAEMVISTTTTENAQHPAIAVSNGGDVHVVWADDSDIFGDSNYDIMYRRWDASSSTWTPPILVSTISTSTAAYPDIAVDGEGNAHVVWHDYSNILGAGSYYDIFYRMWNKSTNTWSGHTGTYDLVTGGHYYSCQYPAIALDSLGNIHVVWTDDNDNASLGDFDTAYDIYYKCWNATTKLWDASMQLVSNESTSTAQYPCIATDSQGNLHVVWEDYTNYGGAGSYYDIFYKHWNASTGLWSGYLNPTDVISVESTSYAYRPSIAVDGDDNVHIAWYDSTNIYNAGSDFDIFYRMWNTTTQVWSGHVNNTDVVSQTLYGSYNSYYPTIGADELGNIHIAWRQLDNYGDEEIQYTMWDNSTRSWGVAEVLCPDSWREINYPDIAVHPAGDSHVVWHYDNYDYEIRYRKSIVSPPIPPTLQPFTPNPSPNYDNELVWSGWMGTTKYYIYRNTSYISSIAGLTPIGLTTLTSYSDVVSTNGTYYYVVVAENSIGNSSISNCEGVNVSLSGAPSKLRISDNAHFAVYGFPGNGTQSNPWLIEDMYLDGDGLDGIRISNTTDHFIIRNCTMVNCNYGINLLGVTNGQIINNTVRFGVSGIYLGDSDGNTLVNNTVHDNTNPSGTGFGFSLYYSDGNWFEGNRVYNTDGAAGNGGVGFWLYGSSLNNLIDNYIYNNMGAGMIFEEFSDFNNLTGNQIYSNSGTLGYDRIGVAFPYDGGHNNRFVENNIYDHTDAGISSSHCGPNIFINNTIHDNKDGIYAVSTIDPFWQFRYNKFYNNTNAVNAWFSTATFFKNEFWNNSNGLIIAAGSGSILTNNTAWNNTNTGIVASANNMKLYNNTAYDNGNGIRCEDNNIIADGNLAYNNTGYGISVQSYHYDILTQITNNFAWDNDIGIYFTGLDHPGTTNIDSNTVFNNREGFHGLNAANFTVTNNNIYNNTESGFYLEGLNTSTITWNTILGTDTLGTTGIHLLNCWNATVQFNEITNQSQYGIYIQNTNHSTFEWNLLFNNSVPLEEASGVNNTIGINPSQPGPVLNPIVPSTVDDGWVHLQWQTLSWATYYQVFRSWESPITEFWDIIWSTPVLNVTANDVWDTQFSNTGSHYYVVVAANSTAWSTISNTEWVNVTGLYGIPGAPILNSIVPAIDYNGIIELDWADAQNATDYFIYRDTSVITDLTGLTAIAKVSDSNYTDTVFVDDTFYYVVVGSNNEHNGTMSNCENVTAVISPIPNTPILSPIIPLTDYDGIIYLNWTDAGNATHYYVYRDVAPIITLTGLDPITTTIQSNYTDVIFVDGVYYYAVTSANLGWNSSPSNCENVSIMKQWPVGVTYIDPISPSTDLDGVIQLSWNVAQNASWYYVYKDTVEINIATVASLIPIATVASTNFTDYAPINGSFYYAIVGGNFLFNGTPANSEMVTVTIPARTTTGWTIPSIISIDSKNSSSSPKMVMDAEGNLFVVWADAEANLMGSGSDIDIFCRIWNASTRTWSSVTLISTESISESAAPAIALDTLGNLYVAWEDLSDWNGSGTDRDIFYKLYNVSTKTWSQTVVVTPESGNESRGPAIAVDGLGNIYVVWWESNGSQTNIYENLWNATSGSWSGNITISSEILGGSQNPQITVDANYNVHIVWDASTSYVDAWPDDDIFYRMWNNSGQYWSAIELVSSSSLSDSNYPTIALKGDGTVCVAWHDLSSYAGSGSDYDIFYRSRNIGTGTWWGNVNSTDVVSYGSNGPSIYPSITIDKYSVVHIVWVDYSDIFGAGTDADIFYKFWNSSSFTWQGYINATDVVTALSTEDAFSASVAVTRNQQGTLATQIHVVWQDKTNLGFGADWDVYYKSCLDISPYPGTPYLNPITPAIDYDGIINLVWTSAGNTTKYFVYRDTSSINNVSSLTPIAILTTETNYTDILYVDGTYYYIVVAGNQRFNSSLSNCENVTLIKYYPVGTSVLSPITPSLDYDGTISLVWSPATNATIYYIYQDVSEITDISGLVPINATIDTNEDVILADGTYYFVVVAGNPGYNGSLSNCVNVTVEIYYPVATPLLSPIVPNPDYDGIINLDWSDATNATVYYIYRHFTTIINITGLVPIANITESNYLDVTNDNFTWYYAIVAGNPAFNSSISNCENVTVEIYPIPETPILNFIFPSTNYYGVIQLDWTDTANTTHYYVYRDIYPLGNVTGLTPIAVVWDSNYTDYNYIDGTYSYAIVAANYGRNGSISNIQNVTIEMYYPISTPVLNPIIPSVDYDGIITIDWNDLPNATRYYVYRNSSLLDIVIQSNYTDTLFTSAIYSYAILAGNPGYNSSLSSPENVTIIKYWPVAPTTLEPITPMIDYDGLIFLNWSSAENASQYFIYRNTGPINTISGLTPHALVVGQTNYTDVEFTDGIYYYVVVASNLGYNSTISNSQHVLVQKQYPVGFSLINPISPGIDTDGYIYLTWTASQNATFYRLYKDTAEITSAIGLTPIATITSLNYTDYCPINDTFYYAIVPGNFLFIGTVDNSEAVTVAIPARTTTGWTSPIVLSDSSVNDSTTPSIVVDAAGNKFVVWADASDILGSGSDVDIFCRIWNAATGIWGSIILVSNESSGNSTNPEILVDNANNLHVTWVDISDLNGAGTDSDVFYKLYNASTGTWTSTVVITTESAIASNDPTIAVNSQGYVFIAWWENNGTQTNIYQVYWNATGSYWTANSTVTTEIVGDSRYPKIGVDNANNNHFVWEASSSSLSSGSDIDIFYRMFNWTSQSWHPTELVSALTLNSTNPSLAVDGEGNVYVTWQDLAPYAGSGPDSDIFFKFRNRITGSWNGFINPADVISMESDMASLSPSIALDDDLNVHICWIDYSNIYGAGSDADIFYKFYNRTSGIWSGIVNTTDVISGESSGDSITASIIAGSIHIVWQDKTHLGFGPDWDIFYKQLILVETQGNGGPGPNGGFDWWIILIIIIGAVAGVASMMVLRSRKKPGIALQPSKMQLGEARSQLKDSETIPAKIHVLQKNKIPLGLVSELYDPALNEFFGQQFNSIPTILLEFLQKLDAPLEDKLEILEEFNNLSDELKQEFLDELNNS